MYLKWLPVCFYRECSNNRCTYIALWWSRPYFRFNMASRAISTILMLRNAIKFLTWKGGMMICICVKHMMPDIVPPLYSQIVCLASKCPYNTQLSNKHPCNSLIYNKCHDWNACQLKLAITSPTEHRMMLRCKAEAAPRIMSPSLRYLKATQISIRFDNSVRGHGRNKFALDFWYADFLWFR